MLLWRRISDASGRRCRCTGGPRAGLTLLHDASVCELHSAAGASPTSSPPPTGRGTGTGSRALPCLAMSLSSVLVPLSNHFVNNASRPLGRVRLTVLSEQKYS